MVHTHTDIDTQLYHCLAPGTPSEVVVIDSVFMFQAFELATGDYLFEPHSGEDYTRDEGEVHCDTSA